MTYTSLHKRDEEKSTVFHLQGPGVIQPTSQNSTHNQNFPIRQNTPHQWDKNNSPEPATTYHQFSYVCVKHHHLTCEQWAGKQLPKTMSE